MVTKSKVPINIGYIVLQIIFLLVLCLLPSKLIISSSVVMFLLGATLLIHSNKLISSGNWSNSNIYNFVIIILTIFFIPAYAAFRIHIVLFLGIMLIIANLVVLIIIIYTPVPKIVKDRNLSNSLNDSVKQIMKKAKPNDCKIVAIKGGSKFHSLDCKMIEGKSKKRLQYYVSAHEAQQEGLKPCKLCKAVSYLHHW